MFTHVEKGTYQLNNNNNKNYDLALEKPKKILSPECILTMCRRYFFFKFFRNESMIFFNAEYINFLENQLYSIKNILSQIEIEKAKGTEVFFNSYLYHTIYKCEFTF